jgi:protein TonB
MFEDSLIESGGRLKTKRGVTTFLSFGLQIALVGVLVLIPLLLPKLCQKPS